MTNDEAKHTLAIMLGDLDRERAGVNRKRSLRPSERAMWLGSISRQQEALQVAIKTIEAAQ